MADSYRAFVKDVLDQARAAAADEEDEGPQSKRKALQAPLWEIRRSAERRDHPGLDPGLCILDARFVAGTTSDVYLRSGVATLAVLRPGGSAADDDLSGTDMLYAPRSVEQVRQGVVATMKARRQAHLERAPRVVQMVAAKLTLYLEVDEFRRLAFEDTTKATQTGDWALERLADAATKTTDPVWLQDFGNILATFRGALNAAAAEGDMCDKLVDLVTGLEEQVADHEQEKAELRQRIADEQKRAALLQESIDRATAAAAADAPPSPPSGPPVAETPPPEPEAPPSPAAAQPTEPREEVKEDEEESEGGEEPAAAPPSSLLGSFRSLISRATSDALPDAAKLALADRKLRAAIGSAPMPRPPVADAAVCVGGGGGSTAQRRVAEVGALHAVEQALLTDLTASDHQTQNHNASRKRTRHAPSSSDRTVLGTLRRLGTHCAKLTTGEGATLDALDADEAAVLRVGAAGLKLRELEHVGAATAQRAPHVRPRLGQTTTTTTTTTGADAGTQTSASSANNNNVYALTGFAELLDAGESARRELLLTDAEFQALVAQHDARADDRPNAVDPSARRNALWSEVLRELSVSNDRLLVTLRAIAGLIGEPIENLIVKDEAAEAAQQALQEQELEISKKISELVGKLLQTLLAGMADRSTLAVTRNQAGALVVIDQKAREQMTELARGGGEASRQFFNASVTLRNLVDADAAASELTLRDVLATTNAIAAECKASLLGALVDGGQGVSASLGALSLPRHAHVLLLRSDVVAAISSTYDRVLNACAHLRREISLWELCEGGSHFLSHRWAECVAHQLQSTRASVGLTSMQVPRTPLVVNAIQARVAHQRLVAAVAAYFEAVPRAPRVDDPQNVRKSREAVLRAAGQAKRVVAPLGNRAYAYGL